MTGASFEDSLGSQGRLHRPTQAFRMMDKMMSLLLTESAILLAAMGTRNRHASFRDTRAFADGRINVSRHTAVTEHNATCAPRGEDLIAPRKNVQGRRSQRGGSKALSSYHDAIGHATAGLHLRWVMPPTGNISISDTDADVRGKLDVTHVRRSEFAEAVQDVLQRDLRPG